MLVLQASTYKGGLDTLDDPECNLGDHKHYYFCLIGQIWTVPGGPGRVRAEFLVRTIVEADDQSG